MDVEMGKDKLMDDLLGLQRRISELEGLEARLKRAVEELEQANDYLENILENSPDAIGLVDMHGRFIKWNRMAAELYGYTFEELRGKLAYDLYAHREELDEMIATLRREGSVKRHPIHMKRKDGSSVLHELSISLLKDSAGRTLGSICVVRDLSDTRKSVAALEAANEQLQQEIAERQRVEEALRKSESSYRTIFENTGTATVILEEDLTILLANAEFERLSGYTRDELEGKKSWREFIVRDDVGQMEEYLRSRIADPDAGPGKHELKLLNCLGDVRNIFLTVSGIPGTTRSVCSMVDISEQRKLEEEVLRARKLESLGVLAGGIAHDFNNILTAVLGNLSLAKMYAKPGDDIYKRLEQTEKASLRARDLTQQLLTFSRGGVPIKNTLCVSGLIRDSVAFALRGSNVRCSFSVPDDLWPVEVDEGQISQVISNLVINADQAMPEGGAIRVRAENIVLNAGSSIPLPPGRHVKVCVQDQGVGIPREHLSRIFDPYFTTKQKGSGLGLATVYSIISKHDGYISVESEPNVGATFCLYLPASRKVVPQREVLPGKPEKSRGQVLVMDDEEAVRNVLGEMLDFLGYEMISAQDGTEAIELYQKSLLFNKRFDAVIMDLTIPGGMGGKDAIRHLLRIDPEIKAIVSSGYSNDPVMANFREYGFVGVVTKPYKLQELSETLLTATGDKAS